jgi:hypothetical protein
VLHLLIAAPVALYGIVKLKRTKNTQRALASAKKSASVISGSLTGSAPTPDGRTPAKGVTRSAS